MKSGCATLWEGLETKETLQSFFIVILFLRKLFSVMVVALVDNTDVQVMIFVTMSFTVLLILCLAHPYKSKVVGVMQVLSEVVLLVGTIGLIALNQENIRNDPEQKV